MFELILTTFLFTYNFGQQSAYEIFYHTYPIFIGQWLLYAKYHDKFVMDTKIDNRHHH